MRRVLSLAVIVVLASVWWAKRGSTPSPDNEGTIQAPLQYAVCPLVQADDRASTRISLTSATPGEAEVALIGRGRERASETVEIDGAGGGSLDVGEVLSEGLTPAVVELPGSASAVGIVGSEVESMGATSCAGELTDRWLLPGATTRQDEGLDLILANPFSTDAVVEVDGSSELGLEDVARLDSVEVPARSTLLLDLSAELPLRDSLAVSVVAARGAVIPAMRQRGGADVAFWQGVGGGDEWFVVVPDTGGGSRRLVLSTDSAVPVPIEVELIGADGTELTLPSQLAAGGQAVIDLAAIESGAFGIRVAGGGPLAAGLAVETETARAVAVGSGRLGAQWLLPGVGLAPNAMHRLWILNPSEQPIVVIARSLRDQGPVATVEVSAAAVTSIEVSSGWAPGVLVEAAGDIGVTWMATTEFAIAMGEGVLVDG